MDKPAEGEGKSVLIFSWSPRLHEHLSMYFQNAQQQSEDARAALSNSISHGLIRFYAAPKELELVRRIYKKKGFTNIVIQVLCTA